VEGWDRYTCECLLWGGGGKKTQEGGKLRTKERGGPGDQYKKNPLKGNRKTVMEKRARGRMDRGE